MSDNQGPAQIVYDGECPFCSAYVRLVRLRETVGPVEIINGRERHPILAEIDRAGLDLNDGMVLKMNGQLYHGEECVHVLALLSSSSGIFNRAMRAVFRSRTASRALYPLLRCGRNVTLKVLGRDKIATRTDAHPS